MINDSSSVEKVAIQSQTKPNYYGKLRILLLFPTDLWYMIRCVEIKRYCRIG